MTPVVASRVGGIEELVTDQKTGRLVGIGDVHAYANALLDVLDNRDKTDQMVARARTFAEQNLRLDTKMAETVAIYKNLIRQRS